MTRLPNQDPARIVGRLRGKLADLDRDLAAIEQGVNGGFNAPLNADVKAAHRAAHKPGVPPKIEADPELKAYIQARLDTMTFDDIVAAVKAAFPPERHVSRSSLHRWWQKIGRFSQPKAT